jgi:hypothetical protein
MAGADANRLSGAAEEAANRAEVTAILIRLGYGVYRPEFDWNGEDLIVKMSNNKSFRVVQLKSRAFVDEKRYSNKKIWMLFPSGPFSRSEERTWYLIPHDKLFKYTDERYGHGAGWKKHRNWSYKSLPQETREFLRPWILNRKDKIQEL